MDDVVDLIEEMPAIVVKRILKHINKNDRKTINELLKYPEDSAGSIMTTEFVDLKENMTVKEVLSLSDTQLEEILDVSCNPLLSVAKVQEGRVHLAGTLSCRILYKTSGGIHCVTESIPFEQTREFSDSKEYSELSAKADLSHFSYHILNHNSLEIRAGLTYKVCLHATCNKEYVEAILVDEDTPLICDRAPIVAYIIKPGDTLFQIAKKYATTVDRLKSVNNIDNDRNLKIGSYLIIE